MMFEWKPDMVRFMRDASECTDFHKTLAGRVLPHIAPSASVCDAGCGLGYLSLALSPHVRKVTAVDVNGDALKVLRENCAQRGITNIRIVQGDMGGYDGEKFDAMIFCLYGQIDDVLTLSKRFCREMVSIVKRNEPFHRFSVGMYRKEHDGCADVCTKLEMRGIPYVEQPLTLALDQPFHGLDDARRFYALYGRDEGCAANAEEFLLRLKPTGRMDFPYVLSNARNVEIITFNAYDITG